MEKEKQRQFKEIELTTSENFVCRAVMEALGSHLTNKYSECLLHDTMEVQIMRKSVRCATSLLIKQLSFGDNGSISPGGVRIGTPAMTSRGEEADFETIVDFLLRAAHITSYEQRDYGKFPKGFLKGPQNNKDMVEHRNQVETFGSQFALPGCEI